MLSFTAFVGRVALSVIFLLSGFQKIIDFAGTQQYMAAQGMKFVPFFAAGALAFEILGGLSLLFGFKTRYGALLLIAFLVPVTLIFHAFWVDPTQQVNFLKNLAIMGGLLQIFSFGAGRLSFDRG